MAPRVLLVDDDADLLNLMSMRLEAAGYEVILADSGEAALLRFGESRPQLVVTDLCMGGMDGMQLFERLNAAAPMVPVIILTAHGTIPDAVAATQRGVFSFLTKPFDGKELVRRVADAVRVSPALDPELASGTWRQGLLTASLRMEELLRQARRIAEEGKATLIQGVRGSGKRTLAEAMQKVSAYTKGSFVTFECNDFSPEELNDLFAPDKFEKYLEAIAGGVLYIDDIDLLPLRAQSRLFSILFAQMQRRQPLQRLQGGSPQEKVPDVFIISASHRSLQAMVAEGAFRSDLFYLMSSGMLEIPPLEERPEDIPLIAQAFLTNFPGTRYTLAPDAMAALQEVRWPGNVAQLKNVLQQAVMQTTGQTISQVTLRRVLRAVEEASILSLDEARRKFEKDYLIRLLQATGGNVSLAARLAQRNRTEFYKLLARYDLSTGAFKQKLS